ncbi:hypothetical protein N7517_002673 [Penicillium concentricum]|uniref:Uncharacterized protein n=1 Tax=Penicillium concentricum TaxID=293559 RepID=A0A9W9VK13_9EURO|nr:uncharacterized protein N7517_002673 [Penicillium concentricum]KAJ5384762.1 hypothetical protein N7517_002673 [Penicillium concentricum]
MQYKVLATLFFAATALAAPADSTATSGTETTGSDDTFDLEDVPSSIMSVLATAIPESWYNDLLDPASLSAIDSAASAGTYPAWYNALPSDVKSWATGHFGADLMGGASATATQTKSAGSSAIETGSSLVGYSITATQTSSNAAETTLASSTSGSSSDSTSSSASSSPSSSQSTGGAPAPTGAVAMGVAGAAGLLALALAL